MKKVIVIGIVAAMVMGLAGMASAYVMGGSAKDSNGEKYMTNLQIGDVNNSAAPQPVGTGGTVELGLPTDQSWTAAAGADAQTWNYKLFRNPSPQTWTIALWGNSYAQSTATVKFWVSSLGNGSTLGSVVTGQTWEFKNATGEVLWTGAISATSSEAAPLISLVLPVVNTTTPHTNASVYTLGEVVPEPGSMLALGSGLVGLVGFAIRRRK